MHIWYHYMAIKRPCYFSWIREFNSKSILKIHSICNNLFCIYFTSLIFIFLPSQDRWCLIYLFIFLRSFCVFIFRLLQHYLCTPFSINFTVTVVIDVVLFVDCEHFEFKIVNLYTSIHIHTQLSWFNRLIIIELFCIELYIIGAICKLFIRSYKIVFNCFVY